jgi:hypothetical protein
MKTKQPFIERFFILNSAKTLPSRDARKNQSGSTGACVHCGKPAAKELHFAGDGIVIIERYCDACSEPSMFESLQIWYENFA